MRLVYLAFALAVGTNPVADLNTPQQIQELVERLVKQSVFSPEEERQILAAVAAELKDPETLKWFPAMIEVRRKNLKADIIRKFENRHRDSGSHAPELIKSFTRSISLTIRAYVRIPPGDRPSAKAVEQMQMLRRIFEDRLAELYPGIRECEHWTSVAGRLDSVSDEQESDFTETFKAELPSEQFEAISAELRQVPEIGIMRFRSVSKGRNLPAGPTAQRPAEGSKQAALASPRDASRAGSTRGRDLQPPAHGESRAAQSNPFHRIPWAEADQDTRDSWLQFKGRFELAMQFTLPVRNAFAKTTASRRGNTLEAYFDAYWSTPENAKILEEQKEIETRLAEDGREKQQRDWERTVNRSVGIRPSHPQSPRPEPVAQPAPAPPPPSRGRLAWVLAINGVAVGALLALYLRSRFRRK